MHVNKIAADMIRAEALQRTQAPATVQTPVEAVPPARAADAVEISDAGLALAGGETARQPVASLDPQRVDQIRSSILSGAYNSLEMADQVARALMRSGDL
jgi:anti-sigma28 factor (negative regulator of flagellin synthesis)